MSIYFSGKITLLREPINNAEEKLSITLRFLATGECSQSLIYQLRIHESTTNQFIPAAEGTPFNLQCRLIYS